MEAAQETDSPVILQAPAGARKYTGEAYPAPHDAGGGRDPPRIPVVMHQDHGTSAAVCQQSIRFGFTSADLSEINADYGGAKVAVTR